MESSHHIVADCIFCKIATSTLPASKIYEDAETMAFLNIKPVNPGHALVIPKDHYENVYSVPPEIWARMALTAQKVAVAVREATDADGINIEVNNEPSAGQIIFHSHIHIIPRHEHDGFKHWPGQDISDADQQAINEKVKKVLENA
jgi:histidine triad (HIT) family protein